MRSFKALAARDAGDGVVELLVDPDMEEYPETGQRVVVVDYEDYQRLMIVVSRMAVA